MAGNREDIDTEESATGMLNAIGQWRQADWCYVKLERAVVVPTQSDEEVGKVSVEVEATDGLILLSQTCDVVPRMTWENEQNEEIVVAPLIQVSREVLADAKRATRPRYCIIPELFRERIVADLGASFTITKSLLAILERSRSENAEFPDRFVRSIKRFYGRFAFPDGITEALRGLRSRILEKHNKTSRLGCIYRSIREIRIVADSGWDKDCAKLQFLILLEDCIEQPQDQKEQPVAAADIRAEVTEQLHKASWPSNFDLLDPPCRIETVDGASARDLLDSVPLDLNAISG